MDGRLFELLRPTFKRTVSTLSTYKRPIFKRASQEITIRNRRTSPHQYEIIDHFTSKTRRLSSPRKSAQKEMIKEGKTMTLVQKSRWWNRSLIVIFSSSFWSLFWLFLAAFTKLWEEKLTSRSSIWFATSWETKRSASFMTSMESAYGSGWNVADAHKL